MRSFGVDEAGKGPVLGPMVAACIVAAPESLPDGVADSKQLRPARRESLASTIRDRPDISIGVARVDVDQIDDPQTDMNSLTVAAHAEALTDAGVDGLSGMLDAGEVDAERFGRRVQAACDDRDIAVTAAHRADAEHELVAAASIIAKVERDEAVAALATEHGPVGSGYPADPTTRAFLRGHVREHGSLPICARKTWQTSRDVLAAAEQGTLDEF